MGDWTSTASARRIWRSVFAAHPARTVVVAFAAVTVIGTVLPALPVASEAGKPALPS
jgi:hypothetical protein